MHHIATKWLYHEPADSCCVWFWNLPRIRLKTAVTVQISRNFAACLVFRLSPRLSEHPGSFGPNGQPHGYMEPVRHLVASGAMFCCSRRRVSAPSDNKTTCCCGCVRR
jgi:hypothetical protein